MNGDHRWRRRSSRGGFHNPMRTRAKSKDLRIFCKNRGCPCLQSILNLEVFYYDLTRPDGGNLLFFLHSVFGIGLESPWFEWRPLRRRSVRGRFHNPRRTRAKSIFSKPGKFGEIPDFLKFFGKIKILWILGKNVDTES